jgi:glycosyltransferase involved in cell wall biosynthesis
MRKTFFIIGNFGYASKSINGQTIKTRYLKEFFETVHATNYCDTDKAKHFLISIISMIFKIPMYSSIIVTVNRNGLKYIMPVIFFMSKLLKKELHFIAVGGWLADFVKHHNLINLFLKKFDKIFVESRTIVCKLEEYGYKNVRYLFNFKTYNFERYDFSIDNGSKKLKMVFVSRVMWEKGMDIVEFIAEIIDKENCPISIDIYGPIQEDDKKNILEMINKYACLKYGGVISPDEVHEVMSSYDVFLFPTHWDGECFPGVILDAFIAGVPIIASNWKYNAELITNDVGYLFELGEEHQIIDFALKLYKDPNLLCELSLNSYNRREEYSINKAKEILKYENVI